MALQIALGVGAGIYLGYILIRLLPTVGALLHLGKIATTALLVGSAVVIFVVLAKYFWLNPDKLGIVLSYAFSAVVVWILFDGIARVFGVPEKWAWIMWNFRNNRHH
jgi:hypothetical protein